MGNLAEVSSTTGIHSWQKPGTAAAPLTDDQSSRFHKLQALLVLAPSRLTLSKVASRPLYAVESQSHVTFWKRIVSPYNPLPRQHLARSFAQRHTGVSRFRAMTATGHLCLWPVNGPIVPCAVERLHATNH